MVYLGLFVSEKYTEYSVFVSLIYHTGRGTQDARTGKALTAKSNAGRSDILNDDLF